MRLLANPGAAKMADTILSGGTRELQAVHVRLDPDDSRPDQTSGRNTREYNLLSGEVTLPGAIAQRIADVRRHLTICEEALHECEAAIAEGEAGPELVGVSPITIRTLAGCLSELLKLEWTQPHRGCCQDLCKLLDCPQTPVLRQAVVHTIEVLEATKFRFKSKELKRLREDLEKLLGNSADFSAAHNQ